jgi:hypothetical protein
MGRPGAVEGHGDEPVTRADATRGTDDAADGQYGRDS